MKRLMPWLRSRWQRTRMPVGRCSSVTPRERLVGLLTAGTRRPEVAFFDFSLAELELTHPLV